MAANAKTRKCLESVDYKKTKQDYLDQLERNGTTGKYFYDLVDDYMNMWITQKLLTEDIQKRGPNVKYDNGGGQKGIKKNDSVELSLKINQQMLKLLDALGIKPVQAVGGGTNEPGEM
jgi:hypothetical protein